MSFTSANTGTNLLTLAGIAGKVVKATSQVDQGKTESAVLEFNAGLKQREAFLIGEKAKLDLVQERETARRDLATASAMFAGRGVRADVGSATDVLFQIAEAKEMDRLINQFNTDIDVSNKLAESNLLSFQAGEATKAGKVNAFSTILGTLPDFKKLKFTPKPKFKSTRSKDIFDQLEAEGGFNAFG